MKKALSRQGKNILSLFVSLALVIGLMPSLAWAGEAGKPDTSRKGYTALSLSPQSDEDLLEYFSISDNPTQLRVGQTVRFTASYEPANLSPEITWSSEDESVVTVDTDGNVTAVSVGYVRIFAQAGAESDFLYVDVIDAWELTFDANGGMFEDGSDVKVELLGKEYPFSSFSWESPIPANESEMFAYWSVDAEGTAPIKDLEDENGQWYLGNDITLYAQYRPYYTVTLNSNGHGYVDTRDYWDDEAGEYGDWVTDYLTEIERQVIQGERTFLDYPALFDDETGLVFDGWCYDQEGLDPVGDSDITPESDVTLYAKWAVGYTVTLDAGESGTVTEWDFDTQLRTWEETVKAGDTFYPYRYKAVANEDVNQAFEGWYYDSELTQRVPDRPIKVEDHITLYAGYVDAYTITFDANGGHYYGYYDSDTGEWVEPTQESLKVAMGSAIEYQGSYPSNDDAGLLFDFREGKKCWNTKVDGTGTAYSLAELADFVPEQDLTLYAVWTPCWVVSFDTGSGPGKDDSFPSVQVAKGSAFGDYGDADKPAAPDGTAFAGWSTVEDIESAIVDDIASFVPSEDTVLYAIYTDDVYQVTFDVGEGSAEYLDNLFVKKGAAIDTYYDGVTPAIDDPAKVFGGWMVDGAAVERIDGYVPTGDTTFTAIYVDACTITFDANGTGIPLLDYRVGYSADSVTLKYAKNGQFGVDPSGASADGEGASFEIEHWDSGKMPVKWTTQPDGTGDAYNFGESYTLSSSLTLYLQAADAVDITFDAGEGLIDGWETEVVYTFAKGIPLQDNMGWEDMAIVAEPDDETLEFKGWSTDGTEEGLIEDLGAFVPAEDIYTLYAVYGEEDGEDEFAAPTDIAWDTSGESPAVTFKGVEGAVKYNVVLYCDRDNGRSYTTISFSPTLYHNPSPDTAGTPYKYSDSHLKQIMDEGGAGNWTFRVEALGNAEGTVSSLSESSEEYKNTVDISNNKAITITNPSSIRYDGTPIRSGIFVQFKNNVRNYFLEEGTDYTVSYENNVNVGRATATITGIGNYTGSVQKTFDIYQANVYSATVTGVSNKTYNGKAQTQNPTVKMNGVILKNGTDYTISYKNNVNVGTATLTITGKGNYTGAKSVTFKINSNKKAWVRLKGSTAYDTMQSIVKEGWKGTGGTVIVATGEGFADALAAAGIAGLENAPILTTTKKSLSAQTRTELNRLKPSRVIIVGGRGAVSEDVENAIKGLSFKPTVTRHKGAQAFNTANAMNLAYADKDQWSTTAILATSKGYADALSAAPIAYSQHMPIFLVKDKDSIDAETIKTMKTCGIKTVMVVGGRGAVSDTVRNKLKASGFTVDTRKGASQYDTSIEVAKWGLSLGMSANKMGVATGRSYADALAGAALCGQNNAVLVLSDKTNYKTCLPVAKDNKAKIDYGYVYGGRGAVPADVQNAYETASGCPKTTKW